MRGFELSPGAARPQDVFLTVLALGTRDKLKLPVLAARESAGGQVELTVGDTVIVLSDKGVKLR